MFSVWFVVSGLWFLVIHLRNLRHLWMSFGLSCLPTAFYPQMTQIARMDNQKLETRNQKILSTDYADDTKGTLQTESHPQITQMTRA
jgi:hypothetical protein